jgi:hypothetical protein
MDGNEYIPYCCRRQYLQRIEGIYLLHCRIEHGRSRRYLQRSLFCADTWKQRIGSMDCYHSLPYDHL